MLFVFGPSRLSSRKILRVYRFIRKLNRLDFFTGAMKPGNAWSVGALSQVELLA